eukprot:gene12264-biopygen9898
MPLRTPEPPPTLAPLAQPLQQHDTSPWDASAHLGDPPRDHAGAPSAQGRDTAATLHAYPAPQPNLDIALGRLRAPWGSPRDHVGAPSAQGRETAATLHAYPAPQRDLDIALGRLRAPWGSP